MKQNLNLDIRVIDMAAAVSGSSTDDIDRLDDVSVQCMVEYVDDVFRDLRSAEAQYHQSLKPIPLSTASIASLVDWMIESHTILKLKSETLFLAVSFWRYLSLCGPPADLRTLGASATMLAASIEETHSVTWRDFARLGMVQASDSVPIKEQAWQMATKFAFHLWTPHPMHFLRRYSKAANNDVEQHARVKYYCETALLNYHDIALRHLPSCIACACILLGRLADGRPCWSRTLAHYTGYTKEELTPLVMLLWLWLHAAPRPSKTSRAISILPPCAAVAALGEPPVQWMREAQREDECAALARRYFDEQR